MQLAFDNRPAVLVDDAHGAIAYHPACIGADDAERWFAQLRDSIVWQAERRRMYEREVDVPRLTAHFRLDAAGLPAPLAEAAAVAARVAGCTFNSVGLNYYRDGRDSVAPHNDRLHRLVAGAPIALLSLGGARRMLIRARAPPRRTLQLDLDAGSVLLMSYATQRHFDHGIPKTRAAVAARISLAFRCLHAEALDNPWR